MRKYFFLTILNIFLIILFLLSCNINEGKRNFSKTVDKRPVIEKTKVIRIGCASYFVLRGSDSCQYLSKAETADAFNWQTLCHYPQCDNPIHKNK